MTDQSWPPTEDEFKRLVGNGESALLEFKRQWPDWRNAAGKAELAKMALAMANSAAADRPALLVFGVSNDRSFANIEGAPERPTPETVQNILAAYIMPPPRTAQCEMVVEGQTIDLLRIEASPSRPHHAVREHPGILALNVVYARRGKTIGTLTLPEIEALLRDKLAVVGPIQRQAPIQWGFVGTGTWEPSGVIAVRLMNVIEEPVAGIELVVDVASRRDPSIVDRQRHLSNAVLQPGESREVALRARQAAFYKVTYDGDNARTITHIRDWGVKVGDRWLDVTARLHYRDRDGIIQADTAMLFLDS